MPDMNKKSDLNYERYDICYINGDNPMTMHSLKSSTGNTMFSLDARFELLPEKTKIITQIEKYFNVKLFKEHTKHFEYIRKKKYRNDILKHITEETRQIFYEMITPYNNRGVICVDSNDKTHLYMNGRKASDDDIHKLNLQKVNVYAPHGNNVVITDKDNKSLLLQANKEILKMQASDTSTVIQSPGELTEFIDNNNSKIIWDFLHKDDDVSNNIKHLCILYPNNKSVNENEIFFFEVFPLNLTLEKFPVKTPLHYLFRIILGIQKPIKIELVWFHNFDYNGPMGGVIIGMDEKGNCMLSSKVPTFNQTDEVKRISSWNEIKRKRTNVEDNISLMFFGANDNESYILTPEGRKDLLAKGGIKEFYRSDKQDYSSELKIKLIS
jgi:hypothetical protein